MNTYLTALIVGIAYAALLVAVWFAVVYSLTTPYERKQYKAQTRTRRRRNR